jgi:hypothetical protein
MASDLPVIPLPHGWGGPDGLRAKAQAARAQLAPRRAARAPEERGERLATLERGPHEQLRVVWDTYEGHPFVSLRRWTLDTHGQWWPDPHRGVTVRVRELPDVADALALALDRLAVTPSAD